MCDPVGYDEPLEPDLAFENLIDSAVVLARISIIDEVWYGNI